MSGRPRLVEIGVPIGATTTPSGSSPRDHCTSAASFRATTTPTSLTTSNATGVGTTKVMAKNHYPDSNFSRNEAESLHHDDSIPLPVVPMSSLQRATMQQSPPPPSQHSYLEETKRNRATNIHHNHQHNHHQYRIVIGATTPVVSHDQHQHYNDQTQQRRHPVLNHYPENRNMNEHHLNSTNDDSETTTMMMMDAVDASVRPMAPSVTTNHHNTPYHIPPSVPPQQHRYHYEIGSSHLLPPPPPYEPPPIQPQEPYGHYNHNSSSYGAPPPPSSQLYPTTIAPTMERMTGVEIDTSHIGPLIVMDGANIAYAYSHQQQLLHQQQYYSSTTSHTITTGTPSTTPTTNCHSKQKIRPNLRGIQVAYEYFRHRMMHSQNGPHHHHHQQPILRIMVVLPQSYIANHTKKHPALTDYDIEQSNIMNELLLLQQQQASSSSTLSMVPPPPQFAIVTSPSHDDDDAYVLQIALRESKNNHRRRHCATTTDPHTMATFHQYAYILSNDMYRDAQERDTSHQLYDYLNFGYSTDNDTTSSSSSSSMPTAGPGRISYTFCNMGHTYDDYGDLLYDIIPNPRHPFIQYLESQSRPS